MPVHIERIPDFVSGMALATGSSQLMYAEHSDRECREARNTNYKASALCVSNRFFAITSFVHRSLDHILVCRPLVHAPAASAVPLTFGETARLNRTMTRLIALLELLRLARRFIPVHIERNPSRGSERLGYSAVRCRSVILH
jgi:hypothetical protein